MNETNLLKKNLFPLLEIEHLLLLLALVASAWLFYFIFLKEVSLERHRSLKRSYQKLIKWVIVCVGSFVSFQALEFVMEGQSLARTLSAVLCYLSGSLLLVRSARLWLLQYLFRTSMKAGVPILLVNIFTLGLSLAIAIWTANHILGLQLAPLLATSAVLSIVLGLALQETLGNIFSGISLQIDRSFEIGDWLEVISGVQKTVGQVKEITWRSTVLEGWSYEIITLPNRSIAASQINNYGSGKFAIMRTQSFKVKHNEDLEKIRKLLLESVQGLSVIRSFPKPLCFISETTDSWINFKLAYYINSFGQQFLIGDKVIEAASLHLASHGIELVPQALRLVEADKPAPIN